MKPVVRIHAILGSVRSLEPTVRPRNPSICLPGGLTATRWLSQGASSAVGWPLSVEAALNEGDPYARHCLLNLSRREIELDVLTDELDPRYQNGLPWILAVMSDVTAQISILGAKAVPGWVILDLDKPGEAQRVKKVQSWCARQGLDLGVLGEIEGAVGPTPSLLPYHPLSVVQDVSGFLKAMEFKA
jgi:hypothetical protein